MEYGFKSNLGYFFCNLHNKQKMIQSHHGEANEIIKKTNRF